MDACLKQLFMCVTFTSYKMDREEKKKGQLAGGQVLSCHTELIKKPLPSVALRTSARNDFPNIDPSNVT